MQTEVREQWRQTRVHYDGLDNELDFQYPVHRQRDYVHEHAYGFKQKKNSDLFKHIYRLFKKNKFKMREIKK